MIDFIGPHNTAYETTTHDVTFSGYTLDYYLVIPHQGMKNRTHHGEETSYTHTRLFALVCSSGEAFVTTAGKTISPLVDREV